MTEGPRAALVALLFFLPGYLVFKAKESVVEAKTLSKFELSLQSIAYSVAVLSIYLLIPWSRKLIDLESLFGEKPLAAILSVRSLYAGLAFLALTLVTAVVAAVWKYHACYHRILTKLGFRRLNKYITTWEEFADIGFQKWVCVRLDNDQSYIGVIRSITHHPYQKELILSSAEGPEGNEIPIQIYDENFYRIIPEKSAEYILFNMESVRWIAIIR